MPNTTRKKVSKKMIEANSGAILIETKTLEDFKCGNCGLPLLLHILLNGGNRERIVECKNCKISFPLEKNNKSNESKISAGKDAESKTTKNNSANKKESLVERLVKSW
ncbi:MAG: hypothetical protein QXV37_01490 [Candidatus Jordarchaeaceae archaeon]